MCFVLFGFYILFYFGFGLNELSYFMYCFYCNNYLLDYFEYCDLIYYCCRDRCFLYCMVEWDVLYDFN